MAFYLLIETYRLMVSSASLPLLRPVFHSFGGIFSGLKSTASPNESYMNVRSTHTFGSAPTGKRSRATRADLDTDSVLEFADEGAGSSSSKSYALRTMVSDNSEEGRAGIYVTNEMKVDFSSASGK